MKIYGFFGKYSRFGLPLPPEKGKKH